MYKQPLGDVPTQPGTSKPPRTDSDEGSLSSGTYSLSGAPPPSASPDSHPVCDPPPPSPALKESDILSDEDDDGFSETGGARGDSSSPTSAIDAQFLQLKLSEDAALKHTPAPRVQPERVGDTPDVQPKRGKRRSRGALLTTKEHRSLDGQTDPGSAEVDVNALLEREYSVQSLTSVVNEDCFYDPGRSGDPCPF